MLLQKKHFLLFLLIITYTSLQAREGEAPPEIKQDKTGNFSVIGSMQQAPFLGFGQTIIDQFDLILETYPIWVHGKNIKSSELLTLLTYGLRNDLSLVVAVPAAISIHANGFHSAGIEDLVVQFEYAFYANHKQKSTSQFTVVTRLYFPTGSECKNPPTGFGSPAIFLGVTAERLSTEWYCYTSYAALFTTSYEKGSKFGNQFLYQTGFGRNIAYSSEKWTLSWLVEFYGLYTQKTKINCVTDPNSGFNEIIVAPSIWYSTNQVYVQGGIGPIIEHTFGVQTTKARLFAAFGMGVRF